MSIARAFILSPKLSDQSVISASSQSSKYSAPNLLRPPPSQYWQATSGVAYVEGNFSAPLPLNTLVFGYANSLPGDTFRLRLGNTSLVDGYDSGNVLMQPSGSDLSPYLYPHSAFTFPLQTFQYYRVDFSFTSNVRISRLILGKRIEPIVSLEPGWEIGAIEDCPFTSSAGSEESARVCGAVRSFTIRWHHITESEREQIYTLLLERGSAKEVVISIENSEGLYSMSRLAIGRIKRAFKIKHTIGIPPEQCFGVGIEVKELGPTQMRIGPVVGEVEGPPVGHA